MENSECEIYDSETTISNTAPIYGYTGSTAEAYAEKYYKNIVSLSENPQITTTESTTATTSTTITSTTIPTPTLTTTAPL